MNARILIVLRESEVESFEIEELILARSQLHAIDAGYQDLKLETPEWVIDKMSEIGMEINLRVRSELQRRLKTTRARRSALRTADEKRTDLDLEIAELEKKIA